MQESYGDTKNSDSVVQLMPTSFVRGGDYSRNSGSITNRGDYGYYWWSRAFSSVAANYLFLHPNYLWTQYNYYKGDGYSLRCLVR